MMDNQNYCIIQEDVNRKRLTTMCIIHKGFSGFRAISPALISGGVLIGLKPAIPYAPYTQRCMKQGRRTFSESHN